MGDPQVLQHITALELATELLKTRVAKLKAYAQEGVDMFNDDECQRGTCNEMHSILYDIRNEAHAALQPHIPPTTND